MTIQSTRVSIAALAFATCVVVRPVTVSAQPPRTSARNQLEQADAHRHQSLNDPLLAAIKEYDTAMELARIEGAADVAALALLGKGQALRLLGYAADAKRAFLEARDAFKRLQLPAKQAAALIGYGSALTRLGERGAGEAFKEALALARSVDDRLVEADALLELGWLAGGLPEERLKTLEQAITMYRELKNTPGVANVLFAQGLLLTDQKGTPAAIPLYEEALKVARAADLMREQGFALSLLGYAFAQIGETDRALRLYRESLPLSERAGDHIQEIYTHSGVGSLLMHIGRLRQASDEMRRGLALSREIHDRTTEGFLVNNLGVVSGQIGELGEARKYYEEALTIHRANEDKGEESITLLGLAALADDAGDHASSLDYAQRAVALAREAKIMNRQIAAQSAVGRALVSLGRYREAVDTFTAAVDASRTISSRAHEVALERYLGMTFTVLGNAQLALEHFNRAIGLAGPAKLQLDLAVSQSQAAAIRAQRGEIAAATALARTAIDLIKNSPVAQAQGRVYENAASVALASGDLRRAVQLFEDARAAWQRAGDRLNEVPVLTQLGRAYLARRNVTRALDLLTEALAASHTARTPEHEAFTLATLMQLWRSQRQPALAAFFGKQAVNLFQRTRANLLRLPLGVQRAYVESRAQIYRELADLLISEGRLPEAQSVLNLLKNEEFQDFIRRDGPSSQDQATLTPDESRSQARYLELQERHIAMGNRRGELLRAQNRTRDEQAELEQVEKNLALLNDQFVKTLLEIREEFARVGARGDLRITAVEEAQGLMGTLRALGKDTVVVYTLLGPERYRAILITADARKAADTSITPNDLARRVLAFRRALEDPHVDPRPLAQDLYRILVKPIESDLQQTKATTILWSLDGVLRYVPIAALHDGRQYMVERYANVMITLASNPNLKDQPHPSWTGIGAGVSRGIGGFSALPAVADELHSIFRVGNNDSGGLLDGQILLDESFTKTALTASLRDGPPLVHLASHFQFRPGDENDSFLLLGDGEHLTLAEVRRATTLFEGVDLLTLSACDTAVGSANAHGDELEGFAVIAQQQGAKAVVAGLWPVADASTRVLMQRFYAGRAPGVSKAEALRRAQLVLLRGEDAPGTGASTTRGLKLVRQPTTTFVADRQAPWSHPYYWAPFLLLGNSR